MKKNLKLVAFSAILLILAGGFFSCNNKEELFLTVDETPMLIETAEAGIYSIAVISNGEWTAVVENADWCTLNNSTGSGDAVITVNIAENTRYTPRNTTVKITSGSLTKSVIINQNAAQDPECSFDSPLTDLLWLKEFIDGLEKDAEAGFKNHARIYQCHYKDGIGFLLEICVGCPDFGYWLTNCAGEELCIMWGHSGKSCSEFDVDFENKILIWEMTK